MWKVSYICRNTKYIELELNIIDIEIKKRSIVKDFLYKLHDRLEDLFFKIIMKLPERLIPSSLMEWLERYTLKRINQIKQQNIKQTWRNMYLKDALDNISNK